MYRDATVGVVVPAYNEEAFVGRVLDSMPPYVDRVYAVDDCSTDGTWSEIQARAEATTPAVSAATDGGQRRPGGIVPLRHEVNRGRGAAVKTGYRQALRDDVDVVAVMDGDGQMDPDQLDRLLDPVISGRAAYAKGNRLASRTSWRGMPRWRLFGNLLLTLLTRLASGYWSVRDSQNGYTAIAATTLARIDLDGLYDEYGFLNDLLVELNVHDRRVADVDMGAVYGEEQSDIRYATFVPSLSLLLLWGFLRRLTRKYLIGGFHPLVFLYGLGAALGGVAALRRLRPLASRFEGRGRAWSAPLGALFLALAVLLDKWRNDHLVVRAERAEEE